MKCRQATDAPPALTSRIRLPQLDGLRGLAIVMVLICHYLAAQVRFGGRSLPAQTFGALIATCWSGVDLFFVLSGFLIGGILLDEKHSPHYFKVFYIRRACRIFPLYYLVLLSFSLAMLAHGPGKDAFSWLLRLGGAGSPLFNALATSGGTVVARSIRFT